MKRRPLAKGRRSCSPRLVPIGRGEAPEQVEHVAAPDVDRIIGREHLVKRNRSNSFQVALFDGAADDTSFLIMPAWTQAWGENRVNEDRTYSGQRS